MDDAEKLVEQERAARAAQEESGEYEYEWHPVPFFAPVMAFHPGAAIREALAQWWEPQMAPPKRRRQLKVGESISADELRNNATALWRLLDSEIRGEGVVRDGQLRLSPRLRERYPGKAMEFMVHIDYPLVKPVERAVELDLSRLGELFGIGYDMYAEVYEADAKLRGGAKAPRIPGMMNRQSSDLIWGHDFEDLVYEGLGFLPASAEAQAEGLAGSIRFMVGS